jgi:hypothetical protein
MYGNRPRKASAVPIRIEIENGGLPGRITEVANQIISSTDSQSSLAKD